jgi:hypothetical protein
MLDRLFSCLVALGLSLLVFLYTRSRDQETLDNVPIAVKVVVAGRQADLYSLEVNDEAQVTVAFTGPPARLRELQGMLQRKELHVVKTVTVPDDRLDAPRVSDSAVIEAGDLNTPLGVTALVAEGRNRVPYTLHRLAEKRLPVRFDHIREEPAGTVLLDPPTVLVRGPREVLDRMTFIATEPSELPTRPLRAPASVAAIGRVPVVDKAEGRPVKVTPPTVTVRVPGVSRKTYELIDVPVAFLCPPDYHFRPLFPDERNGKVTLKVTGPIQDEPPRASVYIDLTKARLLSGLNNEPVQVQLPPGFTLEGPPPRGISFELRPADFSPEGLRPADRPGGPGQGP